MKILIRKGKRTQQIKHQWSSKTVGWRGKTGVGKQDGIPFRDAMPFLLPTPVALPVEGLWLVGSPLIWDPWELLRCLPVTMSPVAQQSVRSVEASSAVSFQRRVLGCGWGRGTWLHDGSPSKRFLEGMNEIGLLIAGIVWDPRYNLKIVEHCKMLWRFH